MYWAFSGYSETSYDSGDDSANITDALHLEYAKKFVQDFACNRLNISILDKKGGCPKKPTKDINKKIKCLSSWIRLVTLFGNFLQLLLEHCNIQCGQ